MRQGRRDPGLAMKKATGRSVWFSRSESLRNVARHADGGSLWSI
jgi:hypothetical protein